MPHPNPENPAAAQRLGSTSGQRPTPVKSPFHLLRQSPAWLIRKRSPENMLSAIKRLFKKAPPGQERGAAQPPGELTAFVKEPGTFSGRFSGRTGLIVYREGGKSLKFEWEISGVPDKDILVSCLAFTAWTNPAGEEIPEERQLELLAQFRRWLAAQKIRSDIDLPAELSEEPKKCIWYGCEKQKLRVSPYCRHHFDLTCLKR